MTNEDLIQLIDELRSLPKENEWVEFKQNRGSATNDKIGQYISSLSNAACIGNQPFGYLVFGIENETHNVMGTSFRFKTEKVENAELELWLRNLVQPTIRFQHFFVMYQGKYIELLQIPAAKGEPTMFKRVPYIRFDSSLADLRSFPDHIRIIYNSADDWSARIIDKATLADLDESAILKAREKYKEKHSGSAFYEAIDSWDTGTFLDKVKITIAGKITNAALILLGKPESSHFLLPSVAEITWKLDTEEKAYEHFEMPLFLSINKVLARIRNVKYKFFPDNALLSVEVNKYETKVILEALNNCIAHQDYSQYSRIILTEQSQKLIFSNAGSFYEGKADDYLLGNKTPKKYRNRWLAMAMVNLNMIDTLGYGIHRMFIEQRKRYFPLPDYNQSTKDSVVLEIFGHSIDENYSKLLIERADLTLTEVVLLDKVQKNQPITDDGAKLLKKNGLIEGRKPHYFVSAQIANLTNSKAQYTRNIGFKKQYYKDLIIQHITLHGSATRVEIDELLIDKLPELMTLEQRRRKIHNLLSEMSGKEILNTSSRTKSVWVLNKPR